MQLQVLSKILACGLGTGSAACLALKQAADAGELTSPAAQRLQLGLMGFSSGERACPLPRCVHLRWWHLRLRRSSWRRRQNWELP